MNSSFLKVLATAPLNHTIATMLDLLPDIASLRDYSLGPVWYSLTLALSVPLCLPSPPFEIVGGYIFSPSVAVPL